MLLEPNIVWDHTKGYYQNLGKHVESMVSPGEFFEGWHKGGRLVSWGLGERPARGLRCGVGAREAGCWTGYTGWYKGVS